MPYFVSSKTQFSNFNIFDNRIHFTVNVNYEACCQLFFFLCVRYMMRHLINLWHLWLSEIKCVYIYNIYTHIHYKIKYTHKHTHTYTHSHILPWNETRLKNRSKLYICNHDICLSSLLSNCFNNTVKINCTVQLQILETMQDFMTLMKMMLEEYLIHPQIVGK